MSRWRESTRRKWRSPSRCCVACDGQHQIAILRHTLVPEPLTAFQQRRDTYCSRDGNGDGKEQVKRYRLTYAGEHLSFIPTKSVHDLYITLYARLNRWFLSTGAVEPHTCFVWLIAHTIIVAS